VKHISSRFGTPKFQSAFAVVQTTHFSHIASGSPMRLNQSLVVQRDRQYRHGFRRGTGEVIKQPVLAFFLAPLRQQLAVV
jgi:hypothetical protein